MHLSLSRSPQWVPLRPRRVLSLRALPTQAKSTEEWSYTAFMKHVQDGTVASVVTDPNSYRATVEDSDGITHTVGLPKSFQLTPLLEQNVDVYIRPNPPPLAESVGNVFNIFFQMVILGALLGALVSARSSGSSAASFLSGNGFPDAAEDDDAPTTTFDDVAGLEAPKQELMEIVEFLKNPEAFAAMGAELPRGILLYGEPGTGKTLLAKAVAGEAGVPFLFCSGSEFVQIFVGVGASRVRDLFKKARAKAPCIVFIDEIDAIGRARTTSNVGGANTEQEQTMNQILTEMDGFKGAEGIMVIAATNRKDILDDALVRSGRFDRHVQISLPTKAERVAILGVHTRGASLAPEVSLEQLASLTQGMSGADLKTLVNEAKLLAVRQKNTQVTQTHFVESLDKLWLGLENRSVVMTEEQARLVAYHEAGHALLGILADDYDRLDRVTIVPRGDAGGLTVFQEKEQDLQLYSQQYLLNRMVVALGGRVAEQCVFGSLQVTTGASSDLDTVQNIARRMVTQFGFNETLGNVSWSEDYPISGSTSEAIDAEIKYLVEWAHTQATQRIQQYEFYLHRLAEALLLKKTLYTADILKAIEGITCEPDTESEAD